VARPGPEGRGRLFNLMAASLRRQGRAHRSAKRAAGHPDRMVEGRRAGPAAGPRDDPRPAWPAGHLVRGASGCSQHPCEAGPRAWPAIRRGRHPPAREHSHPAGARSCSRGGQDSAGVERHHPPPGLGPCAGTRGQRVPG
jgi:hypothetical protein